MVCVCRLAGAIATRTRVIFLQHPRERRMAIGTARLAHLALPGSELRVGLDFAADRVLAPALAATPLPYVLFPGPDAHPVGELPRDRPNTIIVIDGTWSQARKLLRLNPALAALPRVSFAPQRKSAYQIRRQPADHCVSTIEALGEVLSALEPEGFPVERLLQPFFAMVARQQRFASEIRSARHRKDPGTWQRRDPQSLQRLRAALAHVVCVHGEANAWPLRHPSWQPAETIHWVAQRLSTGARYEALLRPRRPLAPATLANLGLDPAAVADGQSVAAWKESFAAFVQPGDLFVHWGGFPVEVAGLDGLTLGAHEEERFDLRAELSQWLHRKAGPVDDLARELVGAELEVSGEGRAGRRLAAMVKIVQECGAKMPFVPR
jgi:DTW domain-containing protein YfiP